MNSLVARRLGEVRETERQVGGMRSPPGHYHRYHWMDT